MLAFIGFSAAAQQSFLVQRGTMTIGAPATNLVTLDTPVAVGKSFVVASCRGGNRPRGMFTTVELTTIVEDKYTQLEITKRHADGTSITEWQVIAGSEFTVQSGKIVNTDFGTATRDINEVDLSKAFLFLSAAPTTTGDELRRVTVRGRFTSATRVEFVAWSVAKDLVWYVVEWEGARVQSGILEPRDNTVAFASLAQPVDLDKAFVYTVHNNNANPGTAGRAYIRTRFTSPNEIEFMNGTVATNRISWFVVEHDDVLVHSGLDETAELSIEKTIPGLDTNKTFMPVGQLGNAYTDSALGNHTPGANTHQLESATNAVVRRTSSDGNLYASWFVVQKRPPQGTVIAVY